MLVPATWELMSMDHQGKVESLAKHVLSFDLAPEGEIVYTNGSEVFRVSAGQVPNLLCAHRMIQQVMIFE